MHNAVHKHSAIHRMVVRRLLVAGVLIALVITIVALAFVLQGVRELALDRGVQAVARFEPQIRSLLDAPGPLDGARLQWELEAYGSVDMRLSTGRFVHAVIYDLAGQELARNVDRSYGRADAVDRAMAESDRTSVDPRATFAATRFIENMPHVHVGLPLSNSGGEPVARIEGVFALTEQGMADIRRRLARTALVAIGIVLVTAAVLYPVIASLLRRLSNLTVSLLESNLDTLQVLGNAIAKRDSDTDLHNYRVTIYAVRLAESVGHSPAQIQSLIKGAFLHDVGKIGIRDHILLKPGKLSDEEYSVMKTHVSHGLDIVKTTAWLEDATDVVGFHHEKCDGSGYDNGLQREGIPIAARIFAIADVFDALSSKRPYKDPFPYEKAMAVLNEGRGTHFDPDLLDAFARIAPALHEQFANVDGEKPRQELAAIVEHYFFEKLDVML